LVYKVIAERVNEAVKSERISSPMTVAKARREESFRAVRV